MIKIEYDDHTEEYGYLTAAERIPYSNAFDFTQTGKNLDFDKPSFSVLVSPNDGADSFSAVLPEEKDGQKITAVSVLSAPFGSKAQSDHEDITLKTLYIPSAVR